MTPNERDYKAYKLMRIEQTSTFIRRNMGEDVKRDKDICVEHFADYRESIERESADEIAALKARCDELLEFANAVVRWSEAYPDCIFVEPTPEQVNEVCKNLGCRIDNISAMILRQFTKPWGDKARAAIANAEKDKTCLTTR